MTRKFKIIKTAAGTVLCGIGIYLIVYFFSSAYTAQYVLNDKQLTTLTGYLISTPYYHEASGRTSSYFEIKLDAYPGISFRNESVFLDATRWKSVMADIKYGDTVFIKVHAGDFEKLYLKRDEMNFFQQLANHPVNNFSFYSLKFKNKEYVSDLYRAAKNEMNDHLFSRTLLSVMFIAMGIYCFVAKK